MIATGTGALYGARMLAVVLDSLLITLGLYLLMRYHRRSVLIGALVALTPSVLFFGAVVNSSGMEIAAAFAAWCAGLCIVTVEDTPRSLVVWTSVVFVALIFCRPTSWISALVILTVLGVLGGWNRCRRLVNSLHPLWGTLIVALAIIGGFLLIAGTPNLLGIKAHPAHDLVGSIWLTLRLMGGQIRQTIAVFGWLSIVAPTWVIAIWVIAIGPLICWSLAISPRARRALPLLAAALFLYPFVFETPQMNTVGPYWQGRYWLPLAVGLPLIAAAELPSLRRVWVLLVGVFLAIAQLGAFVSTLDTYRGHTVRPGDPVIWTPPLGSGLTIALFTVGQLLLLGTLWATWNTPSADARQTFNAEAPVATGAGSNI